MVEITVFTDSRGRQPFRQWHSRLDPSAANRVSDALARIEAGNLSSLKGLGGGLLECRLHFGPGYRICLGRDGDALVILLGGGRRPVSSKTSRRPVNCGESTGAASARRHDMALTSDYHEIVQARIRSDPSFGGAC